MWSSSASVSRTLRNGVSRGPGPARKTGVARICARMSGEAFSRCQACPSALKATLSWVRAGAVEVQWRQAQFHCGKPPPAAVPSRITFIGRDPA